MSPPNPQRIEAIRESAGLNRPFIEQFGLYIWNLLHGQFGNSLTSGRFRSGRWSPPPLGVSFKLALVPSSSGRRSLPFRST